MTTASVCWLQNGIFCPWQQGHTFVWLFGGDGCTPPPSPCCSWKWTFCLCVFNASNKTAAQRQGQLSHRTAATIVCMFAYTCVHGPSAHRCKLCVRGFLLGFWKIWTETAQAVFENARNVSYSCLRLACGWVGLRISPKQQANIDIRQIVLFII